MPESSIYPTDWQSTVLGALADYINGYPFKPRDWSTIGTPIIRIAQMSDSNVTFDYYTGLLPPRLLNLRQQVMLDLCSKIL